MTIRSGFAAACLISFVSVWGIARSETSAAVRTQQPPATQQPQQATPDMMKMHEQMMAEMKANRMKLDALVKAMNSASGNAKIDATASVVTELVRQHNAMFERMEQMHGQMMKMPGMMGGRGR